MRLFQLLIPVSIFLCTPAVAQARNVNLLHFDDVAATVPGAAAAGLPVGLDEQPSISREVALGETPFFDLSLDRGGVKQKMRMAMRADHAVIANPLADPKLAIDLGQLPTSRIKAPRWLKQDRPKISLTTDLAVALSSIPESRIPVGLACDNAAYRPTWWLSSTAEARRAAWFPTVSAIACEFGVPTLLFDALIAQESRYDASAVSYAGAMGMAQIMPDTARYLGLWLPFEPVANLRAGARYLREQLDRFGGRVDLALAAYNAGPGRVERNWKIPNIRQTIDYVSIISSNWQRLATLAPDEAVSIDRGQLAAAVVAEFPYRRVNLLSFGA